jgi:hypothetical protein
MQQQATRVFQTFEEFERACFPRAVARREHDAAMIDDPGQHLGDKVIAHAFGRRPSCSICAEH